MLSLFVPPVFASKEQTQRARILHFVAYTTALLAMGFMMLTTIHRPNITLRGPLAVAFVAVLSLIVLQLNRRGRTRLAGSLFAGGLIALMTVLAVTAGGVRSPGVTMYFVIVLMMGLLVGEREGAMTALVCAALGFALLQAERFGLLPPAIQNNSTIIWLLSCLYMAVVVVILRLPAMFIKTALGHAESELSERKRAERLLQENQKLLQTMIENTPAAVAMFDTEMRYLAHSRRWLADYRLGDRDLKGLSHYEVFPEIGEDWKDVHRRCMTGAKESRDEDTFPRADGTEDIVRWVVEPWRKGDGDIGGITMFTEVITEQVRAREERIALTSRLLQAQKIEALGTLAGGIAHDFNNLLATIGTNAELGLAESHKEERAHCFNEIVKATARAKEVVRQILLFSRRQDSARKTISLLPLVEDALAFLRATLPANVEFRVSLERDLPLILGNESQIYQILMNLGTNAGHAMQTGGLLSVRLDGVDIAETTATACGQLHKGEYVRVTVEDTGTGMSPETLDRIFEPFFTTKGPEGTGLGLSVVHGLVNDHGGAITIDSEPGRGSTFQVYFPAACPDPGYMQPKEKGSVCGDGQHIMYIDDEAALGSAMKRALELLGYRCAFYSNPQIAVEAFRTNPQRFDAIISDVAMPLLSGFDVAKELRAIRDDIPIALTSGRAGPDIDNVPSSLGIKASLFKPATIDELSDALEIMLRNVHAKGSRD